MILLHTLPPALYVMTYHEVSWSEDYFFRGARIVTPPDIFRRHLAMYKALGTVMSLTEGLHHLRIGSLTRPTFVITFDDGFRGVLKYALPILREFECAAALSVCPSFLFREEFFWRCELWFVANTGSVHLLRHRLKKFGYQQGSLRGWTSHHFSYEVRTCIREFFLENCPSYIADGAWRLFLTPEDCSKLIWEGWVSFMNHSWKHYFYGRLPAEVVAEDLSRSDQELRNLFGSAYTGNLALPFGGAGSLTRAGLEAYRARCPEGVILSNNNVVNFPSEYSPNYVGRIDADNLSVDDLYSVLHKSARLNKKPVGWL